MSSSVHSVWDVIAGIRDPHTRLETCWMLAVGCVLAAASIMGTAMLSAIIAGGVSNLTQRWAFPARAAEIEQLRRDARNSPCSAVQQVLAQVVAVNMEIASQHRRLATWYLQFDVTRKWIGIAPIEIPCR